MLMAVAVLVVILAVWVATRHRPTPSPMDLPSAGIDTPSAPTPSEMEAGSPSTPPAAIGEPAELPPETPEETGDSQTGLSTTKVEPPKVEEPSWEFTPEELAAEPTATVTIGLGKYQVRPEDEFDVKVTLKGPPLQAVVLALVFDRSVVEPIPDSGEAVGNVFRKGVEFFIHPTEGRAALFCATQPGKKNVLGARDEVVATFRMRAKAAGKTSIGADDKGLKLVGGSGMEIRSEFLAGEVTVSP